MTAHQGPAATAPVTHTWTAPAAAVPLDVVAQAAGGSWYRVLRFGHAPGGPYWLPAAAVTVTGATTDLPQVPAAPTGLTAAPSDESQMQLSWQAAPTGSAATGYRIERAADVQPRMWTEVRADSGTPATTWADSGLAAATVYHYRVTGRNAAGLGTPAEAAPGTTRPQLTLLASAPYPLLAQAWPLATAPVTHTWNVRMTPPITLDVMAQGAGGGGWYRVLRFGASADGPYWLPASAVTVTGATMALPQAPGGPGDLMPPTATHNSVTLTWTAPTTGGTVTGYRLWRQTGEADFRVLGPDLTAATLTFTDTPVRASTLYQYRVQARAAAGYGPRTPAVSVTTAAPPRTPGQPTELRAAPGADSQMQLTWAAPVDPGTPPLTGYRMERSADVLPRVWTEVLADSGTPDRSWTDSGLAAATTYHYQVSAHNAVGVGQPSGATSGQSRPQLALRVTATYPLTAHAWPAATAPVTQTWSAHDAQVVLDLTAQGAGGDGWYRALRFGQAARGPYWLPARAVTVTGATSDLPQAPGAPVDLQTTETQGQVTLIWNAPATGGPVTGYRLWRQRGEAAWAALDVALAAHTDHLHRYRGDHGYPLPVPAAGAVSGRLRAPHGTPQRRRHASAARGPHLFRGRPDRGHHVATGLGRRAWGHRLRCGNWAESWRLLRAAARGGHFRPPHRHRHHGHRDRHAHPHRPAADGVARQLQQLASVPAGHQCRGLFRLARGDRVQQSPAVGAQCAHRPDGPAQRGGHDRPELGRGDGGHANTGSTSDSRQPPRARPAGTGCPTAGSPPR